MKQDNPNSLKDISPAAVRERQALNTPTGAIALDLVRDFLSQMGFEYALSVLDAESSSSNPVNRDSLAQNLALTSTSAPLLLQVLERKPEKQTVLEKLALESLTPAKEVENLFKIEPPQELSDSYTTTEQTISPSNSVQGLDYYERLERI